MIDHPFVESLGLNIDDKSFRECYLDIGRVKEGVSPFHVRPDLNDWVEFKEVKKKYSYSEATNTEVLKYIVGQYDPKSPFRALDYDTRKKVSGIFAGFRINEKGDFSECAQSIMNCEEEIVSIMIIRYCILTRGIEYATYKEFERRYYEIILKDPDNSITNIEKDLRVLSNYRDKFLADDDNPQLRKKFYTIVTEEEKQVRKLRPEYQEEYFYNQIQMKREEIEKAYRS